METAELGKPIQEVIPKIFKRPVLSVSPSEEIVKVATYLAIGPQIYVDGVIVVDEENKPVGRIGGNHIISHVLQSGNYWLDAKASNIMDAGPFFVEAESPLDAALEIFINTGFAFVPVTINQRVVASLSIRDILKVVAAIKLTLALDTLSSQLISVRDDTSIGETLEVMVEKGVRNLGITDDKGVIIGITNDRKILEFLLSHIGRQMVSTKSLNRLYETKINFLDMLAPKRIDLGTPASSAAELMLDVGTPLLLIGNSILTPWDIVMKGFGKR